MKLFGVPVVPRFPPGQTTLVYNWAGKTRNLTCKVKAEPMPTIEWLRYGRVLRDNETFRTYVMSKDSNLQVGIRHLCLVVPCVHFLISVLFETVLFYQISLSVRL